MTQKFKTKKCKPAAIFSEVLASVDWKLLREQKKTLVQLTDNPRIMGKQLDHLDGIIGLIDSLQDEVVVWAYYSSREIFGFGSTKKVMKK